MVILCLSFSYSAYEFLVFVKSISFSNDLNNVFLISYDLFELECLQESSEFHKRSFECAVDSIRAIAASHLWQVLNVAFWLSSYVPILFFDFIFDPYLQLVVVRADLNGHLKALKDYFLLAKGDFFQVRGRLTLLTIPVLVY